MTPRPPTFSHLRVFLYYTHNAQHFPTNDHMLIFDSDGTQVTRTVLLKGLVNEGQMKQVRMLNRVYVPRVPVSAVCVLRHCDALSCTCACPRFLSVVRPRPPPPYVLRRQARAELASMAR